MVVVDLAIRRYRKERWAIIEINIYRRNMGLV